MVCSIRLTNEEKSLFQKYADLKCSSVSAVLKNALIEKIEDEYDLQEVEKAYSEFINSNEEARPIEELWKELEI